MAQPRRIDQAPQQRTLNNRLQDPPTDRMPVVRAQLPPQWHGPRAYSEMPHHGTNVQPSRYPDGPLPDEARAPYHYSANEHEAMPNNNLDRSKYSRWMRWGAAAVTAASITAGAIFGISQIGKNDKVASSTGGADQIASASYNPADTNHDGIVSDLESAILDGVVTKDELNKFSDPNDSANVGSADLVTAYAGDFDNWRKDTYNILDEKGWLNDEQKATLAEIPDKSKPKEEWNNQEVMNAVTLDVADATMQVSKKVGILMMPTVLDKSAQSFTEARDSVGKSAFIAVYNVSGGYIPKDKEFKGITNLSEDARVIVSRHVEGEYSTVEHPHIVTLVDLQTGRNGERAWKELGSWDADDASTIQSVKELIPTN